MTAFLPQLVTYAIFTIIYTWSWSPSTKKSIIQKKTSNGDDPYQNDL